MKYTANDAVSYTGYHSHEGAPDGTVDVTLRAPGAAGTLHELADFLREGYSGAQRKFNLGSTGPNPNNGVLEYNVSGFANKRGITDTDGISAARAELVRESFKLFEEVLGIEFRETTSSNADFFFSDNRSGAFASSTGFLNGLEYSVVNINAGWSGGTSTFDDYTLQTILHEIGHALGLGHQGPYNGSATFGTDAEFANDSWQLSIMSYFSQTENPNTSAAYELLQTPMAADWIALDDLYRGETGGISNAFQGDTIYGVGTNISPVVSDIWANFPFFAGRTASTIVDGGGIDTLDVSNFSDDQRIDLRVTSADDTFATTSDIGGSRQNLMLAAGTVIENARGGAGDDVFRGNGAANTFWGGAGADMFFDSAGADTYYGEAGTDTVTFADRFDSYSFSITGSFLNVINAAIDAVSNTVEWLAFSDFTFSFAEVADGVTGPGFADVTITAAIDNAGPVTGTLASGDVTDDRTPTLSGSLSEALSGGQSVEVLRDGLVIGSADVTDQSWRFADAGLGDGSYAYTARVTDGAQDGDPSGRFLLTIDRTAPVVTVSTATTAQPSPALQGSVDDPDAAVTVQVGGQTRAASNNGDGTWTLAAGSLSPLGAGTYDVVATATDAAGNAGTDTRSDELTILAPNAGKFEIGSVSVSQTNSQTWFSVAFSETIRDAVVVMGPITHDGGQAAVTRVRNVTDTGFEFQIDEWDYLDGRHVAETVGWMAASAGRYEVNGMTVAAGTVSARDQVATSVSFDTGFDAAPVVLAQVATARDAAAVTDRVSMTTADGFSVSMYEEENADGVHAAEDIDWIALGTADAFRFQSGVTGDTVRDKTSTLDFSAAEIENAVFLADMQTLDGSNTAALRLRDLSPDRARFFIEEEQSRDSETSHTTEVVGWFVGDEGMYYA